jgi:hypothetical protein
VLIDFDMTQGSGGDANVVDVKTGSGRANAGEWFLTDDDAANTIPHEYGHLIGLRDEYQVHPGDYREITGNEPPPVAVPAKPPPGPMPAFTTSQTDIAHDLNDSMGILAYDAIQVLTYTSGSLMGDPSRVHDPHDHGVQPRHVQEFADRVAAARGGTWTVQPR